MPAYSATRAQQKLLDFIKAYIAQHGVAPSYGEMAEGVGSWRSRMHARVESLIERGRLRKLPNRARALEVIPEPPTVYPRVIQGAPRLIPLMIYPDAKMFVWSDEAKALVPMERKA